MAETYKEPDKIKQYMASFEANLENATGKTLAQWVKVAKTCPHEKTGERLKWFRNVHGLGTSRAGLVLRRAFGEGSLGEEDPNKLVDALFSKSFANQRPLYEKVAGFAARLGKGTLSPRKTYVALYRLKQYGAVKPGKQGLLLGIALRSYPKNPKLIETKALGGSDRIKRAFVLETAKDFDANVKALLQAAYDEN